MRLSLTNEKHRFWMNLVTTIILILFSIGMYQLLSINVLGPGFPLDDAWIHQTYARNLIQQRSWSFIPGIPSAGSTAPLWTGLVAIIYLLNFEPVFWIFVLGVFTLLGIVLIAQNFLRTIYPHTQKLMYFMSLVLIFEYHLIWAALSGMETLIFAFAATLILLFQPTKKYNLFIIGILVGLTVWIRPDGLTLLAPLLLVELTQKKKIPRMLVLISGFVIIFIPYLYFNQILAGTFWPTTYYAKQSEYIALTNKPLISRVLSIYSLPLIGVGIMLLPGFLHFGFTNLIKKSWRIISIYLWWIGYILIFVIRLPVTYQHGRYIIPTMPIFFIFGVIGSYKLFFLGIGRANISRILQKTWLVATTIILFAFWLIGARAFSLDVAIIESEMVEAARWIANNTKQDDLIAAHDIGALGYFGGRQIIDLAGLITPEVVPIIRDELAIAELINKSKVDYLMVFPDWYESLHLCGIPIYSTHGEYVNEFGGENMTIYQWIDNCEIR